MTEPLNVITMCIGHYYIFCYDRDIKLDLALKWPLTFIGLSQSH